MKQLKKVKRFEQQMDNISSQTTAVNSVAPSQNLTSKFSHNKPLSSRMCCIQVPSVELWCTGVHTKIKISGCTEWMNG